MSPRASHLRIPVRLAFLLALAACGGGEGDSGTSTGTGGGTAGGPATGTGPGSATLSWQPPTENTDGTSVTNLAGYRLYSGTSRELLAVSRTIASPGITTVVVDGLGTGTHYFAVSAYLTDGAESLPSSIGSKTIH